MNRLIFFIQILFLFYKGIKDNSKQDTDNNKQQSLNDDLEMVQNHDGLQSYFYGLEDMQKIIKKQQKQDLLMDKTFRCDPDILTFLSINGPQIINAQKNDNIREQYCDSEYICCSGDHIRKVIPRISDAIHKMRRKYQPYFNLVTIFKSKNIRNFLQQNSKDPKCRSILEDSQTELTDDEKSFFKVPLQTQNDNMENEGLQELYSFSDLTDFDNFMKFMRRVDIVNNDLKYFLDQQELKSKTVICNMCDYFQQQNLTLNLETGKSPVLTVNADMCTEIFRQQRLFFEFRILFRIFFSRLIDYFLCMNDQVWSFSSSADILQQSLKRIVPKKMCAIKLNNKNLFDPDNIDDQQCFQFCSTIFSFNEPFLSNRLNLYLKNMVAVIYKLFNNKSLPKLYKKTFGKDYYIGLEIQRIISFPMLSIFGFQTSLRSLEYKFDLYQGYSDELCLPLQQFDEDVEEEMNKLTIIANEIKLFANIIYFIFIFIQLNYIQQYFQIQLIFILINIDFKVLVFTYD